VESARNRVFAVTHEMRAKAATLKSKRAAVARDWSELARILEQGQATKKVVTSDRVNAALKDAQQMAADTLAAAARAESTATGAVTKANSMSGRAATIAAKACG
jgi:galactokinase/mevalonate kinase-like predicted kinase